ncbi:flagellar hook-basal body complex protein FliE [Microbulbifer sp. TYP-18]|uniref:flagellar hook-basal body complex protein FliE n=1 Tax=Microbulbifer sp. TYP-18 TaxID=3230024 RepID=UPI0034C69607
MEISPIVSSPEMANIAEVNRSLEKHSSLFEATINQLRAIDMQYKFAENQAIKLAAGELENVHQVMTAINKAKLSFELVSQMRNKLLEGYQEIMRMQI